MSRVAEMAVFGGLALGLHVAAFAGPLPAIFAPATVPPAGAAAPALAAAPPDLAALAQRWDAVPEVSAAVAQVAAPEIGTDGPPVPDTVIAPVRRVMAGPALSPPGEVRSPDMPEAAPPLPRVAAVRMADPVMPVPVAPPAMSAALPRTAAPTPPAPALSRESPGLPGVDRAQTAPEVDRRAPAPYAGYAPEASARPQARQLPKAPSEQTKPKPKAKAKDAPAKVAAPAPRKTRKAAPSAAATKPKAGGKTKKAARAAPKVSASAMQQWQARIAAAIRAKQRFPRGARKGGTVQLAIRVDARGKLTGLSLRQSSGVAALDRAALEAARRARLPRAPKGAPNKAYSYTIRLHFKR